MPSLSSPKTLGTGWKGRFLFAVLIGFLAPLAHADDSLPLIVEAPESTGQGVAIFLSGDGGWAAIDVGVSSALRAAGYGVVGIDARRYFGELRTPSELGQDVAEIANKYLALWQRETLLLVGYSRGADTIAFAAEALPAALQARIEGVVLLAPATFAGFKFHFADLWSSQRRDGDIDTLPPVQALSAHVVCVYGEDEEEDSLCPQLRGTAGRTVIELPGGHHFDGDYEGLGRRVLDALATTR